MTKGKRKTEYNTRIKYQNFQASIQLHVGKTLILKVHEPNREHIKDTKLA